MSIHVRYFNIPSYGLVTNPSNEILSEISKIYDLDFEYAELGIEGPEGNPQIINKKKNEIARLLQKFKQKPIGHTAYWIDLCSDYDYVRHAWILEAMREIRTVSKVGIDLINFHANLNGMFYGEKRKILLDNMVKKPPRDREITVNTLARDVNRWSYQVEVTESDGSSSQTRHQAGRRLFSRI